MEKLTLSRDNALPVTVEELQLWCRIDDVGDEEALLEGLILAARDAAEGFTGRSIATLEAEYTFDHCAWYYNLPASPLVSVDKVELEDREGNRTLLVEGVDYKVRPADYVSSVRMLDPHYGQAVVVTATSGYVDIPQPIKQAIAVHAASAYTGREGQDEAAETFERLLTPYRLEVL